MGNIIAQKPLYTLTAASQELIFTIKNDQIVQNETDVKFVASIYGGKSLFLANPYTSSPPLVTLKTSPNGSGVGMFDISSICESFCKPTHLGRNGLNNEDTGFASTFKGVNFTEATPHPIHLIDKYCTNTHNTFYFWIKFDIEYYQQVFGQIKVDVTERIFSSPHLIYNGVIMDTNPLTMRSNSLTSLHFGYNLADENYPDGSGDYIVRGSQGTSIANGLGGKFLTNMPTVTTARRNDYMTVAFFNGWTFESLANTTFPTEFSRTAFGMCQAQFTADGNLITAEVIENTKANGGAPTNTGTHDTSNNYVFFGVGPANMKGRGQTVSNSAAYMEFFLCQDVHDDTYDNENYKEAVGRKYRLNFVDDDCHGFEAIRLCWLNRMGAWDYYTFTKKSIRKITSKRKYYHQLKGSWNKHLYRPYDHTGGKKVFDVKATEKITLNSDYISEEEARWLEELFTSPEVYIIEQFNNTFPSSSFSVNNYMHHYVQSCNVVTSSYTRKTFANDGTVKTKYKIDIEKAISKNIQRA